MNSVETWEVEKCFSFAASHNLPEHDGKCRNDHGHNWELVLTVRANILRQAGPKSGMVIDYTDIKAILDPLLDKYLDHKNLNVTTELKNPTSEELARWICRKLEGYVHGIHCVTIKETNSTCCRYYPHGV